MTEWVCCSKEMPPKNGEEAVIFLQEIEGEFAGPIILRPQGDSEWYEDPPRVPEGSIYADEELKENFWWLKGLQWPEVKDD